MLNCASYLGVPINYLLAVIRETADTLKGYETLIAMARNNNERNMLIKMYREDANMLTTLNSLYISLTGYNPFFAPGMNKPFGSYTDGIETVLLADLQVAQLFSMLYLTAETRELNNLFIGFFAIKCVQATNLNHILLMNKHKQFNGGF